MTDSEINEAIARECGWREVFHQNFKNMLWLDLKGETHLNPPNFVNDLNAMHEAEETLKTITHGDYEAFLLDIACAPGDLANDDTCWPCVHTTARQRAEAFLRTVGKWKDSPPIDPPCQTC